MTRQQYQARIRKLEKAAQQAMTEVGAQAYRVEITKVRAAYLAQKTAA